MITLCYKLKRHKLVVQRALTLSSQRHIYIIAAEWQAFLCAVAMILLCFCFRDRIIPHVPGGTVVLSLSPSPDESSSSIDDNELVPPNPPPEVMHTMLKMGDDRGDR
eukprot:169627_1